MSDNDPVKVEPHFRDGKLIGYTLLDSLPVSPAEPIPSDQSAVAGAIERLTKEPPWSGRGLADLRTLISDHARLRANEQALARNLAARDIAPIWANAVAAIDAQAIRIKALEDGLREARSGFTSVCAQLQTWGHEPYLNWIKVIADIDALLGPTEGRDDG